MALEIVSMMKGLKFERAPIFLVLIEVLVRVLVRSVEIFELKCAIDIVLPTHPDRTIGIIGIM